VYIHILNVKYKGKKMKKPNYEFQKRQKEMKQKAKQEQKRLRKLEKANAPAGDQIETNVLQGNGEKLP
jgi:hypothetical protein